MRKVLLYDDFKTTSALWFFLIFVLLPCSAFCTEIFRILFLLYHRLGATVADGITMTIWWNSHGINWSMPARIRHVFGCSKALTLREIRCSDEWGYSQKTSLSRLHLLPVVLGWSLPPLPESWRLLSPETLSGRADRTLQCSQFCCGFVRGRQEIAVWRDSARMKAVQCYAGPRDDLVWHLMTSLPDLWYGL